MRRLVVLAAALLAVAAAGCGGQTTARTPVVVDTDLSSDDAIALLYLAQSPTVDLRAVTVASTGLVHCPEGAWNALKLLAAVGRRDVPVACGHGTTLHAVPPAWRAAADNLFGLRLPAGSSRPESDAVTLLKKTAPGSTVVELAPMTNLAAALRADHGLAGRIHRVVAMAGALAVPGNAPGIPVAAETNAWLDPAAMHAVLSSGTQVFLVPLDATNQVPVTAYIGETLRRYSSRTAAAKVVWSLVRETGMANGGSYFWDPLAAAAVTDPRVFTTAARRVTVKPDGRTTAGAGAAVDVATTVRRASFERDLLDGLLGDSHYTISPDRRTAAITWDGRSCSYRGPSSWRAGRVVLDTVNRSAAPFEYLLVRIKPPHTVAELKAFVDGLTAPPRRPPSWVGGEASGVIPQHSPMTWIASVSAGPTKSVVVACASPAPPYAALGPAISVTP